ncbi:MAG: hypothetical protein HYU39_03170 [Thaumarchaeota archaeon]|nr:hypothetical protein [Nitrososphaerota archaeon]
METEENIFTEVAVVEDQGVISTRSIKRTSRGIVKRVGVPFCDHCGRRLESRFSICADCGKKLDETCTVQYASRILSPDCAVNRLGLRILEIKVLVGYAIGLNLQEIEQYFHIRWVDAVSVSKHLENLNLLRAKFPAFIRGYEISELGASASSVCIRLLQVLDQLPVGIFVEFEPLPKDMPQFGGERFG